MEDFGMAPVEAQAAGRPVIAYGAGGALDTVIAGETGAFFYEQTADALEEAVRAFNPDAADPDACRANAERFAVDVFKERLSRFVRHTVLGDSEEVIEWS
jgi:glycosyltransferase involved in cell wall biosynthesis